jgi:hypothetical protein
MKQYGWVMVAVVLLIAEVVFFTIRNSAPRAEYGLRVRVPVPGALMVLENIRFLPEEGNIVRISGSYFDGVPSDKFQVNATISDAQNGPPTPGSQSHYTFLAPKPGILGNHFVIDFQSPPMTAPVIYCHVSLVDKETKALGADFLFRTANPARVFAAKP